MTDQAKTETRPEIKIKIENLHKIFGVRPQSVLAQVEQGMSKQELLEQHNHVLGLKDINIDVPARGISVIMGLSGSGKSTLIRHINHLIEPTSGKIIVDDQNVLAMSKEELIEFRRHQASMVFQKFGLHVHRTVAENIAYGLSFREHPLNRRRSKAGTGSSASAWRVSKSIIHRNCRAACSSASAWRARWQPTRKSC